MSRVYRNNGNSTFSDINAGLPGLNWGGVAWGDYDNDGRLDILLTGWDDQFEPLALVYHNNSAAANTAPSAPAGLVATVEGATTTFHWTAASDAQTPASGLSYNLRVGTTPGGSDIVGPMASASSGYRRQPALGNAQARLFAYLTLPAGVYYWSVQAVDTAFAGGPFAVEQSLAVGVASATVLPTSAATMVLPNDAGEMSFPVGLVNDSTTFVYTQIAAPAEGTGSFVYAGKGFTLIATDSNGQSVTQFAKSYTITLTYQDSDWQAAGISDESLLNLYYYNTATEAWAPILPCQGCSLDTAANTLVCALDHLTEFALMAPATPPANLTLNFPGRSGIDIYVKTDDGIDNSATGAAVASRLAQSNGTALAVPRGVYDLVVTIGGSSDIVDAVNCGGEVCWVQPLTLLDHNGNGLAGAKAKPAFGRSWGAECAGATSTVGRLWCALTNAGFTKFALTYNQGTVQQLKVALEASNYTWQTVEATVQLRDHNGLGLAGGKVDQGGGYWQHQGYTGADGTFKLEMFPGSYKFRMGYNHTSKEITQNIATPHVFQAGYATSGGTAIKGSLGGSWVVYTQPGMELLPGTYTFVFAAPTTPSSQAIMVIAGVVTNMP